MAAEPADATQKWPDKIWIVRHGQSAGNVARDAAEAAGSHWIDIAERDMDVPLSEVGEQQARALGEWFAAQPADARPTAFLSSPYVRSLQSTKLILEAGRFPADARIVHDERLREKEFGILDRMTKFGIRAEYPKLDEQRNHVGKF
jgi:broad specificity phosphatase PhoE